jgi:Ca2+-binding RTX toxin-like protein
LEVLFAIGADTLAGARGRDNFFYRSAAEGGDTIQGFVVADDTLQFSAAAFVGVTANAPLGTGQFISGAAPTAAGAAQPFMVPLGV